MAARARRDPARPARGRVQLGQDAVLPWLAHRRRRHRAPPQGDADDDDDDGDNDDDDDDDDEFDDDDDGDDDGGGNDDDDLGDDDDDDDDDPDQDARGQHVGAAGLQRGEVEARRRRELSQRGPLYVSTPSL